MPVSLVFPVTVIGLRLFNQIGNRWLEWGDWNSENARVENAIRAKLQGWRIQEWRKQE